MKIAVFSTKPYDRQFLEAASAGSLHDIAWTFLEARLDATTVALANGHTGVCLFVNDDANAAIVSSLAAAGVKSIALRCAGFNNVDLRAAAAAGIEVARVPAYSPHSVAEHTVALMLALNRKIHRAHNRVREGNFSLQGLMGFDFHGRTVGIVGCGKIGRCVAAIMKGFGCRLLGVDAQQHPEALELGIEFRSVAEVLRDSDVITLHCPLVPATRHLIDAAAIDAMRPGVMLINTSRGAVVDASAVIQGLKSAKIGSLGLDVYEEEAGYFFEDRSDTIVQDDVLARLMTFPNVLITSHQAFFTREALETIAATTVQNIIDMSAGQPCANRVVAS